MRYNVPKLLYFCFNKENYFCLADKFLKCSSLYLEFCLYLYRV